MAELRWNLGALDAKLARLRDPDVGPVLEALEQILDDDNRRGVLAGEDGDGRAMPPTVRQGLAEGGWRSRRLPDGRVVRYYQAGRTPGPRAPQDHGCGDGPPLAPQGDRSRTISNYRTAHYRNGPGEWVAFGAWEDVLSRRGVPFLPFHFRGEGNLPLRDLAGLRPDGWRLALEAVGAWCDAELGGS